MQGREEVEPSQKERELRRRAEWEAAPTAEAHGPWQGCAEEPCRNLQGNVCREPGGDFLPPTPRGGSPKHGVLQQRSLQSVKAETAAKGFSLLRAKVESDSGSALVAFGVGTSQPSFLQQGLGEGQGTKEDTGACHGMVVMRNEGSCFRLQY